MSKKKFDIIYRTPPLACCQKRNKHFQENIYVVDNILSDSPIYGMISIKNINECRQSITEMSLWSAASACVNMLISYQEHETCSHKMNKSPGDVKRYGSFDMTKINRKQRNFQGKYLILDPK